MNFEIQLFTDAAVAFEQLQSEWDVLCAQLSPRTPHLSFTWCQLWWQHLRRDNISTRDEFFLHTVRDSRGQLVAIAPLMITYKPGLGPLTPRLLQFLGADPSITEARGLVCAPENEISALRALHEYLKSHRGKWDIFQWRGIRDYDKAAEVLGRMDPTDYLPFYLVPLPSTYEELSARLSSNMRKSIRKSYEFLQRDGYGFIVRVSQQTDQIPSALARFYSLHAARSAAEDMKTHRDQFSGNTRHCAQVTDFAIAMAERDCLRIFELEIDGQVVATRLTFKLGDELYLYYSGFDPRWRKYSIMTTLMTEIMKWAIENGMKAVNLSSGSDLGKLRWQPEEILCYNGTLASPSLRGSTLFSLWQAVRLLRQG